MLSRRAFVKGVGAAVGAAAVAPWLADAGRTPTGLGQTLGYDPHSAIPCRYPTSSTAGMPTKSISRPSTSRRAPGRSRADADVHGGQWGSGDRAGTGR